MGTIAKTASNITKLINLTSVMLSASMSSEGNKLVFDISDVQGDEEGVNDDSASFAESNDDSVASTDSLELGAQHPDLAAAFAAVGKLMAKAFQGIQSKMMGILGKDLIYS